MVSMAGSKWLKWAVMLVWLNSLLSELVMNRGVECSLQSASGIVQAASPEQQQTVLTDRSERIALFRLRSSLGLRSREWPKKVDPCATWRGVKCQSGHVIVLNISGFRRTVVGARSPQFAVDALQILTFLQTFNASGFALPGSIPGWFGQLTALRVLDLSSALVTGPVPQSLGQLINLDALVLSRNNLTGFIPPTLGQLSNLRVLDLSLNDFIGTIPSSFSNLVNLTLLDLSANRLQGRIPNGLGELSKLKHLLLANNSISGSIPIELGNLSLLNDLDLSSNGLSGSIPRELGRLKALNNLVLANNFLNDSIPVEIYNCTELRALVLDHNNLSGTLPESLGSLSKLLSLDVSYNNLSGHLPDTISGLLNIKSINVSHNQFYESLPRSLSRLSALIAFDLSYNYFERNLPNVSSSVVVSDERNCLLGISNQRKLADCTVFYSARGLLFAGFGVTSAPNPFSISNVTDEGSGQKNRHLGAIFGGVFGGLGLVLAVIVFVFFILKYERRADHKQRGRQPSAHTGGHATAAISVNLASLGESFTYEQLLQATGEFAPSNLIKNGHSGDLYQGLLEGAIPIVVKRICLNSHRRDAYLAELDIFGKASHTRLVPLLGHCLEREDEKLLVYKYMPNRDLSYALYRKASSPEDTLQSLDWITRLKIAIGAAEGLTFLHHECTPPLVHRDVQASSILLDDKFEVRLGSLSETCPQEGEVHQSVISRLLRISQTSEQAVAGSAVATCAYDVYCFGKVLMELVSGKLGISGSNDPSAYVWLDWALPLINIYEKESVTKIVDPSLIVDEDLLEEVWAMAIVAKSCLNPKPSKRPLMRYILKALENPLKVVREDNGNASARLRTSSRGSWNAALFGSWRHSSSEMVAIPGTLRDEYIQKGILKRSVTGGSQGSGQGGDVSSHKRLSNEIFPEPVEGAVVPTSSTDLEKQED